jgi:hypothetical protein
MLPGSLGPTAALPAGVPRGTDGTAEAGGFRSGLTGHLPVVPIRLGGACAGGECVERRAAAAYACQRDRIVTTAIGDATLVVSELLTNAILHARPLPGARVLVAWAIRERSLEVAVSDGGAMTRPRATLPSLSSIGGRGLAIVENLSWRWGALPNDFGLTVWAVLPAPGSDRAGCGGGLAGYSGGLVGYGGGYRGGYDYSGGAARQQA